MNTAASNDPRIQHVRVTEDEIFAHLADGRVISVPLAWSWQVELIRSFGSNDPTIGYNRWPRFGGRYEIAQLRVAPDRSLAMLVCVRRRSLTPRAGADAVHIAIATYYRLDFLLTWNSAHIANAALRPRIEEVCRQSGFRPPVLCTPDELMGENDD